MCDANISVVLPTENADRFVELFKPNNTEGFCVQESEELDSYSNSHGVSLRKINFQPQFELYDMVYGEPRERSLKRICEEFGVKRLIMHKIEPDSGHEESVTYDKKNGVQYQSRDAYPSPEDEYLDNEETIDDSEAER